MQGPQSNRVTIALSLAAFTLLLAYANAIRTIYTLAITALFYDYIYTRREIASIHGCVGEHQRIPADTLSLPPPKAASYLFEFFWAYAFLANLILIHLYQRIPGPVLGLVIITQLSDVFQYYVGKKLGRNHIGPVSPNKTWEGYIGAYFILYCLTSFQAWFLYGPRHIALISCYYFLGAVGGLLASYVKRKLDLKDYSDLLGPHGGWIDRTDSLYLPAIFLYVLYYTGTF